MTSYTNRKYITDIATLPKKNRDTATCNKRRKFCEVWTSGFGDILAEKHTDRLTDVQTSHTLIAILYLDPYTGDEVMNAVNIAACLPRPCSLN